jgi:predicted DNA-binding protein with PD1-like motif
VVCDPGDEAFDVLTQFARAQDLEASQITAVGAFSRATVGWFDRVTKQYRRIPVDEQCEVLSLIGDVAEGQDGPSVHVHVVLACRTEQRAEVTSSRDGCSRRWR